MAAITFSHKGDFSKTSKFFARILSAFKASEFDKYGRRGVEALRSATPKDTGKTSESWTYGIRFGEGYTEIYWTNSNVVKGVNIAVILQYGHGTKNGGYVRGRDYINPAIKPIFDDMAEELWKEVTG